MTDEMSTLRRVADGIYEARFAHHMGGLDFSGRTVIVELEGGGLLLHAPGSIDDTLAAAIGRLGEVKHLVAPNTLHHLYFGEAAERYPSATRWAAPGLPEKRPDLDFHHVLGTSTPTFAADFEPFPIDGIPWMNEFAFFHARSRSLVVTDLFFNIQTVSNLGSKLFFKLYGVFGRTAQSPIVRMMRKDRAAAAASVEALAALPFERAIPAHGEILETDAKARVDAALAKMRAG